MEWNRNLFIQIKFGLKSVYTNLHSYLQCIGIPVVLHPHQHQMSSSFSHSGGYVMVSQCNFKFHSLDG